MLAVFQRHSCFRQVALDIGGRCWNQDAGIRDRAAHIRFHAEGATDLPLMRKLPHLLKSGLGVSAAEGTTLCLAFIRNIVLARLLSTDDYGICVLIAAVMSSIELLTDVGLDKMLVQDRNGDVGDLQATLASLMAIRGTVAALLTLAIAPAAAAFFAIPQAAWAFQVLAIIIFLRSLFHLDFKRIQRERRFDLEIAIKFASAVVEFVVAVGLAYVLRTFAALPIALLASALTALLISHLGAAGVVRFRWRPEIVTRALMFGWPLFGNGLVLLLMGQADRMLVGRAAGLSDLAIYAVCLSLVSTPTILLDRTALAIVFPYLAEAAGDKHAFGTRFRIFGIGNTVVTGLVMIPLALLTEAAIVLLFGAKFLPPAGLIAAVVVRVAATRIRGWVITGALAVGDTKAILLTNVVRVAGFVLALAVVMYDPDLVLIAAAFAVGDVIAMIYSIWRMNRVAPGIARDALPGLLILLGHLTVAVCVQFFLPQRSLAETIAVTTMLVAFFVAANLLCSQDLRTGIKLYSRR